MIVVIEQHNSHQYPQLIDEMFRLRARIFADRLGWDVQVADGRERDKYDDEGPVYLIYADSRAREVKGSLRLLPTTGPTLLAEFFLDTRPDAAHLTGPTVWECTRFCVDHNLLSRGHEEELLVTSTIMIAALLELAIRAGIDSVLANCDSTMFRLCRRVGCEVEVLGSTHRYGRPVHLGLFPVSEAILSKVKERLNRRSGARNPPRLEATPLSVGSLRNISRDRSLLLPNSLSPALAGEDATR
jgi:acyl homoserine lactone synthase